MKKKPFWKSKTLWVNAITALSGLVPAVQDVIKDNPIVVAEVVAAVNVILRFVTKDKVSLS